MLTAVTFFVGSFLALPPAEAGVLGVLLLVPGIFFGMFRNEIGEWPRWPMSTFNEALGARTSRMIFVGFSIVLTSEGAALVLIFILKTHAIR